jgi:perosamine synthetase
MPPDPVPEFAARHESRPPASIPHSATTLGAGEAEAAAQVIASGGVSQGAEVAAFEQECAAFLGRKHAVAVNSGTAALQLALRVLGICPGSRVAQPSYACAALITATHHLGAEPELCDCNEAFNVDGETYPPNCDAAIAVHLFGATASLPPAANVIEDIAQSFGGPNGIGGVISVTSFYATKMMTTGEGGMLFTDDESLADEARDLRDYDNRDTYRLRYAMKMTDIQAAIGRVQLEQLPEFVLQRREIAARYSEAFHDLPIDLPRDTGHVFFRYVIGVDRRDAFADHLARNRIDAKRPVYRPAHHYLGGEFPNAERAHRRAVSLPIYPALSGADVEKVIDAVRGYFG